MQKWATFCLLMPTLVLAQDDFLSNPEFDIQHNPDELEEIVLDDINLIKVIPQFTIASEAGFAINLDTQEVEFAKNEKQVRPIASITKMMTAYVVLQSEVDVKAVVTIAQADIDLAKRATRSSKLRPGMHFTRERLLNLALMSSENVAAAALGRTTFKAGTKEFVYQMNAMANSLGMFDTNFEDPIGIGIENTSTASDLVRLIAAASGEPLITEFSSSEWKPIQIPIKNSKNPIQYHNTNALVGFKDWNILLSKTGFTNAAGHCVAMIIEVQDQHYAVIVLNSPDNEQRAYDAIKIREWVAQGVELTTEQAKPLSPYKPVVKPKPKPVVHKTSRPLTSPKAK